MVSDFGSFLPWQKKNNMAAARIGHALRLVIRAKSSTSLCQHVRTVVTSAQCTPDQWQLVSAVCVQRPALVTTELTALEQSYADLLADLELETSILSDHELRAKEDRAIAEKKQQMDDGEQGEGEVEGARVTALDLEDAWDAEAKGFTPASRITEADQKNDLRSVDRQLDKPLVLLVKQRLGDRDHWVFPQGPRQQGESMRQAAERVLQTQCGENTKAQFLGNAPCGFYQYTFPPTASMGTGAKVFFFKAWYKEGDIKPSADSTDHMWVTREQLSQYCNKAYLRSVKQFLVSV